MAPKQTALSSTMTSVPTAEANLQKSCQRAATLLSITEKYPFCIHRTHATALTSLETPPRMLRQRPTSRLPCTNTETENEKISILSFLEYHSNDDCAASIVLIHYLIITSSPQVYHGHISART
eukprot:scaffold22459_cov54-Attheya_sp.AAC.5